MNWKAHAGDVMAGAGGAGGPAPDVRHQPPQGDAGILPAMQNQIDYTMNKQSSASTLVVQWLALPCGLHEIVSSNS